MTGISLFWRWMVVCWMLGLPCAIYGEKLEDLFEEVDEKVESDTTFFITPKEVKRNFREYHRIDRSVAKMDRFTTAEHHAYNFQNLGNHGTAAQPIFYTLPKRIGMKYGLTAYDVYFQDPQDIRYYVTNNAYAHFNVILANLGTFMFNGCYTQRLLENWHAGVHIRSAMTEKEWTHEKDVKIASAVPHFDLFTHFKTPNECYHLFTSFSTMRYATRETGGIRSAKRNTTFKFDEEDPSVRYRSAQSLLDEPYMENKLTEKEGVRHKDVRRLVYLYHHYEWPSLLQMYHEMMYTRSKNVFTIKQQSNVLLGFITPYVPDRPNSSTEEDASQKYQEKSIISIQSIGNEIGVKGDLEPFNLCYGLYYRLEYNDLGLDFSKPNAAITRDPIAFRLINRKQTPRNILQTSDKNEHYVGIRTRLHPTHTDAHNLCLEGEYLLSEATKGFHTVGITYQSKYLTLAYNSLVCKPPYLVAHGYTTYRPWSKQFAPPAVQQLAATAACGFPYVRLYPAVTLQRLKNHIYYKKAAQPGAQARGSAPSASLADHCMAEPMQAPFPVYLFSYGGNLDFCLFRFFHIDHTLTWLKDLSRSPYKIFKGYIPPYLYTGRYYYAHQPYGKKMEIETGMNVHFKALYYADGYDIVSQQFYRQNEFAAQGRPVFDLFLNFRISNVKLFVKYSYINEDFCTPKAYFATPFYPGQKKAADIGIHWSFFD